MPSSRRDHAYLEIKRRIVHGELAPGMPLSEVELARQIRTSRTPVREALSRLLEEGYVERVPARGYFVTPITVTLIQNVFEVRRLLEGAAAARAAEFADPAAIARLRALATCEYAGEDAASFRKAAEANGAFHLAVAQASRNAIIVDLVRHCSIRSRASSPSASTTPRCRSRRAESTTPSWMRSSGAIRKERARPWSGISTAAAAG